VFFVSRFGAIFFLLLLAQELVEENNLIQHIRSLNGIRQLGKLLLKLADAGTDFLYRHSPDPPYTDLAEFLMRR